MGRTILPFTFDMEQVNAFAYRVDGAIKAVTKTAIKEARLKEIKQEILNSEKLKAHFEDNPKDLQALRHDKPLHPARVQSHMKHIPDYLMPKKRLTMALAAKNQVEGTSNTAHVPFRMDTRRKRGSGARHASGSGRGGSAISRLSKRKTDPLKSFSL